MTQSRHLRTSDPDNTQNLPCCTDRLNPPGSFFAQWGEAALTSLGFFWKALWAFILGYAVSAAIQTFVTRERMKTAMGQTGPKSVGLGTFFGFISSSCSFAALATARAIFQKGAGLVPALAFLLASTNLVIELGIVIAIFLGWQYVVGEYVGGLLLILFMWLFVRLTHPGKIVEGARERLEQEEADQEPSNWRRLIRTREGWERVANQFVMEWAMVWKDITIGFTVAGIIAVFVPASFFEVLFVGGGGNYGPLALLEHAVVGPLAAVLTFIGSMGNIPLAAVLVASGAISFAGVMAFIFSDLIVIPVVRISAQYFGWRLALYIVAVFFASIVATALTLHAAFALLGILPQGGAQTMSDDRFAIDYTFFLNIAFLALAAVLVWLHVSGNKKEDKP
jgi:uncharacterized membrane protein YraQ (UPF0718 family)